MSEQIPTQEDQDNALRSMLETDSLEPKAFTWTSKGRTFTLQEASVESGNRFRKSLLKLAKLENGKVVLNSSADSLPEIETQLVLSNLYEQVEKDGKMVLKSLEPTVFGKWGDRVQKALAAKIKEMSNLLDKPKEKEEDGDSKKPSDSTQETSA